MKEALPRAIKNVRKFENLPPGNDINNQVGGLRDQCRRIRKPDFHIQIVLLPHGFKLNQEIAGSLPWPGLFIHKNQFAGIFNLGFLEHFLEQGRQNLLGLGILPDLPGKPVLFAPMPGRPGGSGSTRPQRW